MHKNPPALTIAIATIALFGVILLLVFSGKAIAAPKKTLTLHYVERFVERPPTLSNLHTPPSNSGLSGVKLAILDANTSGRFTGHEVKLIEHVMSDTDKLVDLEEKIGSGGSLVIANLPSSDLLELADQPWGRSAIILNMGSQDNSLRQESCRKNIFHTIPSRAMLTDALAQFLMLKRWNKWFLIEGVHVGDRLFAESVRQSAKKFGAKIVEDKQWQFDADMRRNAQAEVPPFTQGSEYDTVIVADEINDFGNYIQYHSWLPRPLAGTQGLKPVGWHTVVEQWGASQLQSRFKKLANRSMNDLDYAGWLAVSAISNGFVRGNIAKAAEFQKYFVSEKFRMAAFKGRRLSFRPWSGQMRQPIPLVHLGALVSTSPQAGYLHQRTDMDTLGFDAAEGKRCANG